MASGYVPTEDDKAKAVEALRAYNTPAPVVPSRFNGPQVNPNFVAPPPAPVVIAPQPVDTAPPALSAAANPIPNVAPFNPTAPQNLGHYVPGAPNKPAAIGGSFVPAAPLVPVASYNPLNISDDDVLHKDEKRGELVKKFTDKKDELENMLADESDPKRIAAIQVQLKQLGGEQGKALTSFDAANKQYSVDKDGNIIDDLTQLPANLTPKQRADALAKYHQVGQGNLGRAIDKEKGAIQSGIDAQTSENNALTAFNNKQAVLHQTQADDDAKKHAIRNAGDAQRSADIDKDITDHNNMKVDPMKVYNNTSTGAAIGTTLLAALTGAFDGLNHINRPNSVVSAVDAIVSRDIDAQKANIAQAGKNIEQKQTALNQFRQLGYSDDASTEMVRASQFKAAQDQLQGLLTQYANPKIQAAGALDLAKLAERQAQAQIAASDADARAQIAARAAPIAGAGANTGFITSMVGGKLMVRNVKTGQVSEANDEQRGKYYDTENKRATTAKTEASIGAPGKQSAKIKTAIDQSSGIPEALAPVLESYSGVGTNVFGTTAETDSRVNNLATKIAKATGRNPEEIVTSWKHAFSNGTAREIITHDAETAEKVRQHLSTPGAGGAEDEKGEDNSGSGE